jgi:DNA-directed RNA polymerase subunit M/transcription elongation factor TFIIS
MNIAATFVRCVKCGTDFRSILTFKTLHDFERAARVGFVAQCSNCYAIFDCNRSNMYCELAQPSSPSSARPVVSIPTRNKPEQD